MVVAIKGVPTTLSASQTISFFEQYGGVEGKEGVGDYMDVGGIRDDHGSGELTEPIDPNSF